MRLELRCYGVVYAETDDFAAARELTWRHVWTCPEGPMPWARPVEFSVFRPTTHRPHGWLAYGKGEYLNHMITEEGNAVA